MYDVLRLAIELVKQLPDDHEGRNTFIMNHSSCSEAKEFKIEAVLKNTATSLEEKVKAITKIYEPEQTINGCQPMKPAPARPPAMPQQPCHDGKRW